MLWLDVMNHWILAVMSILVMELTDIGVLALCKESLDAGCDVTG